MKPVQIGSYQIGGRNPLLLIAGPCVIESEERTLKIAEGIKNITDELGIPFVFKASYDKANRSSFSSFRGPGETEGLAILKRIKEKIQVPILSDVHAVSEVEEAAAVLDILQVPAFLARQTDLVYACGKYGKAVNVKKGQFMAPLDMKNVVSKIRESGQENILLTERGASFGYNNLVVDMRSFPLMRSLGVPVIFDGTHSVQLPGGAGTHSTGQREFVAPLVRAAVANGVDGLFLEVHDNPEEALSDGPNMLYLDTLKELLVDVLALDQVARKYK